MLIVTCLLGASRTQSRPFTLFAVSPYELENVSIPGKGVIANVRHLTKTSRRTLKSIPGSTCAISLSQSAYCLTGMYSITLPAVRIGEHSAFVDAHSSLGAFPRTASLSHKPQEFSHVIKGYSQQLGTSGCETYFWMSELATRPQNRGRLASVT